MLVDGASVSQPAGDGETLSLQADPAQTGRISGFWCCMGCPRLRRVARLVGVGFRVGQPEKALVPLSENYSVTHAQAEAPIWVPYEWEL
jgi:hypothetical protein